jgi:hypothetical protein
MTRFEIIGVHRYRLAELLSQATGALFEAHTIQQNNPMHITYDGACLWDAIGFKPAGDGRVTRIHVYSWDTMKRCVRYGIELSELDHNDFEVSARF